MVSTDTTIGFFTTDADLVVRTWDDWLAAVSGIPAADARGRPLTALVPDLATRGLLPRFQRVIQEGVVETLAPAFHHYLIPCPPQAPARHFQQMQQRVTLAPLREETAIVGVIVTMEDVTGRLERERDLAEQLHSPDELTRLRATEALAAAEEPGADTLVPALGDASWRVRHAAVDGLTRRPAAAAMGALLRTLRNERRDLNVLNSVLQALALSGLDAIEPLIGFLGDSDPELRMYAAQALGQQGNRRATYPLIAAMRDPDPNVSYHAIEALGRLRAAEAMDDLAHVAASGDFFLSFPALDALARIGDATVARQIIPLLNDDLLCTAAADLLSQLAGEEAAMPLAALLNRAEAPAGATARGLATLYDRFEAQYREGAYIADLARPVITAKGVQNLLGAITAAQGDELRALALVLGWLEGPTVDRTLTRLLGQATARREVVEALVRHGPRVTSLLIEQLGAEELDTRQAAVIALGRIGDPAAVPALIQTLLADDRLTIVAAGALAKIGDRQAFDVLLGLLGEPDAAVRQAAISALNSLGHPDMPDRVAALFADPNPFVRESAAKIAGYFGYQQCIAGLLAACHDPDENVRRAAIENLTYLDIPEVLPAIIAALQNDTPKVRAGAARSLAHVESDQARPHLLTLLDDPDPWVRYYAARSIGRHAYPDALNALARLAQGDPGHHVRAAAMEALGRIGGPRAVAILAPLAEAEERDLARAALSALGLVGHPDAMPPLLAGLRSADRERRLDALHALGNRGGVGAAGALQWVAAADSDGIVAQAAIDALARLATPEAIAALIALTADTGRREACIAALANLSETQIELVAQGLEHPQPFVRRSVIEALARMKRSRASDQIINVLNDKDPAVRQTAAVALRRLGSPRAERRLASLAHSDPDVAVRRAAQLALQK